LVSFLGDLDLRFFALIEYNVFRYGSNLKAVSMSLLWISLSTRTLFDRT